MSSQTKQASVLGAYPERVTIITARIVDDGPARGWQTVTWEHSVGGEVWNAIGLRPMEYTVKPGDEIVFYWSSPAHLGRPLAIQVNDGPVLSYAGEAE